MVPTTTFPGLVTIDPIQGLQDYVNEIKPYHTKVFETLVEYVYTDYVNVNIVDINDISVNMTEADSVGTTVNEDGGFENINNTAQATIVVAGGQITSVVVTTPGSNYTFGEGLTVTGLGPGTGLSLVPATLGVSNSITTVTIVNAGSGYTNNTYTNVVLTYAPNPNIVVPTNITEMFDFFITAPTPTTLALSTTDTTNDIVHFTGNVTSDFEIGDLIVVTGSSSGNDGNYHLLTVGYDSTTNLTNVTLNNLTGTNGTTGSVTIYHTDTTYNFALTILSSAGPVTVTEPVTGTTFTNVYTMTVQGNATRAIQPGSIFQGAAALPPVTPYPYLYHAVFVQFLPSFNADGSRNRTGDTTVIGVELDTIFTDAVISSGFIIPFNITGYDDRYDAPYDGMAGYQIVSG